MSVRTDGNTKICRCAVWPVVLELHHLYCARFEVATVLIVRIQVFWVVTPSCMVVDFRRFEATCAFIFKGQWIATRLQCNSLLGLLGP
jgi:hypothetical protein